MQSVIPAVIRNKARGEFSIFNGGMKGVEEGEVSLVKPLSFSSYIVHIYRLRKNHRRGLVGVLEMVGSKGKKAFTNYDELWDILSAGEKLSRRRNQARRREE